MRVPRVLNTGSAPASQCAPGDGWERSGALTGAWGLPDMELHDGAHVAPGCDTQCPLSPCAPRAVRPSLSLLCPELRGAEEPVDKRSGLEKGVRVGLQPGSAVSPCRPQRGSG